MKALVRDKYGPPDVLELRDIDKPGFGDDEVLLKVHAASVNPADWHILRGEPYIARMQLGLRKPKDSVLGCDVAGYLEAVRHTEKLTIRDADLKKLWDEDRVAIHYPDENKVRKSEDSRSLEPEDYKGRYDGHLPPRGTCKGRRLRMGGESRL